ncbi:hypothetical protein [Streptomyces sp. NPDC005385]|uniref:hypothetical protein n=1 Tax=Streptomyces sp. NPDC005385 TaxID=3157039 RepID=UPI0033B8DA8F
MSTFKYRLAGPSGGLAAEVVAECGSCAADGEFRLQVNRNVWMVPPNGINWRDSAWLSFGLAVHSSELAALYPDGLIVRVDSFDFPLAHFRSEVAALAMDGWARNEFNLPDQGLRALPAAGNGGYTFNWGAHPQPFADDDFH